MPWRGTRPTALEGPAGVGRARACEGYHQINQGNARLQQMSPCEERTCVEDGDIGKGAVGAAEDGAMDAEGLEIWESTPRAFLSACARVVRSVPAAPAPSAPPMAALPGASVGTAFRSAQIISAQLSGNP